jgi:hypothetical protein
MMTHTTPTSGKSPIFSNAAYDKLKWVALVFLPAAGLLYFGLAEVWGLPAATQVMATTAALDTFLGAILGISNRRYNNSDARFDGVLVVDTRDPETDRMSFDMKRPVTELGETETITLKVETPPAEGSQ